MRSHPSPRALTRHRATHWVAAVTTAALATSTTSCTSTDPSLTDAYAFLDLAMDTCGDGEHLRLPTSYLTGAPAADAPEAAYLYDVAVTVIAYVARGNDDDLARARTLAASLVALQAADPDGDGRLRNAYPCTAPTTSPPYGTTGALTDATSTGNMAWAGLALLSVYATDHDPTTLAAAGRIATWIHSTTADDRGTGGYTGGTAADGTPVRWISTEHSIDVAAFFRRLATATGDDVWNHRAQSALTVVTSLQDPETGHFWVGTGTDGQTTNTADYVPEDVQAWASLVLPGEASSRALDWATTNLLVIDGGHGSDGEPDGRVLGAKVGDAPDPTGTVWYEGTAHLACALRVRDHPGDADLSDQLLDALRDAQTPRQTSGATGTAGTPRGIPAASQEGTAGGDGTVYDALHTGTTAWFVLAAQGVDPFSDDDGRT